MNTVNITGLDRAAVLAALFNNSQQLGLGILDPRGTRAMTVDQAAEILAAGHTYFDYLYGRVLEVDLGGDDIDAWGYDRDNGDGALARAVDQVRQASADAA